MGDAAALPSAVLNADCWSVDDRQLAAAAPGHTLRLQARAQSISIIPDNRPLCKQHERI